MQRLRPIIVAGATASLGMARTLEAVFKSPPLHLRVTKAQIAITELLMRETAARPTAPGDDVEALRAEVERLRVEFGLPDHLDLNECVTGLRNIINALNDRATAAEAALAKARANALEERVVELEGKLKTAERRGEDRAYADVFQAARRVYANSGNDASDGRAVMTFAERYQHRAILHDGDTNAARALQPDGVRS